MNVGDEDSGREVVRLSRWRRRLLLVIAVGYVVWWVGLLASTTGVASALSISGAIANLVMIAGLIMWVVPLALLFTVGRRIALRLRPNVRDALEDELTRSNRLVAFQTGYWALLAVTCVLYAISMFDAASQTVALPVLIAVGVSVPLLRFAMLERQGDSDG